MFLCVLFHGNKQSDAFTADRIKLQCFDECDRKITLIKCTMSVFHGKKKSTKSTTVQWFCFVLFQGKKKSSDFTADRMKLKCLDECDHKSADLSKDPSCVRENLEKACFGPKRKSCADIIKSCRDKNRKLVKFCNSCFLTYSCFPNE
jgi:hypothetical protein